MKTSSQFQENDTITRISSSWAASLQITYCILYANDTYQSHKTNAEKEQSYLKEIGRDLRRGEWVKVGILRLRLSTHSQIPHPFQEPYSGSKHPTTYNEYKYKPQTFTAPPQPGNKIFNEEEKRENV